VKQQRRFKDNSNKSNCCTHWTEFSGIKAYVPEGNNQSENKWNAAGKEITWDMIHYDVQLIGGMVLHMKEKLQRCKQVKEKTYWLLCRYT
jgi:hypothetical protein